MVPRVSEHHPSGIDFGDVLPEQTSDDVEPREAESAADGDADLQRFLDDKPPHHLD